LATIECSTPSAAVSITLSAAVLPGLYSASWSLGQRAMNRTLPGP